MAAAGHEEKEEEEGEMGSGKWRQMFLPPSTLRLVQHAPLSLLHSCPNSDMSACSTAFLHFPGFPVCMYSKTQIPWLFKEKRSSQAGNLGVEVLSVVAVRGGGLELIFECESQLNCLLCIVNKAK